LKSIGVLVAISFIGTIKFAPLITFLSFVIIVRNGHAFFVHFAKAIHGIHRWEILIKGTPKLGRSQVLDTGQRKQRRHPIILKQEA
jgi:hypothetical protein